MRVRRSRPARRRTNRRVRAWRRVPPTAEHPQWSRTKRSRPITLSWWASRWPGSWVLDHARDEGLGGVAELLDLLGEVVARDELGHQTLAGEVLLPGVGRADLLEEVLVE